MCQNITEFFTKKSKNRKSVVNQNAGVKAGHRCHS